MSSAESLESLRRLAKDPGIYKLVRLAESAMRHFTVPLATITHLLGKLKQLVNVGTVSKSFLARGFNEELTSDRFELLNSHSFSAFVYKLKLCNETRSLISQIDEDAMIQSLLECDKLSKEFTSFLHLLQTSWNPGCAVELSDHESDLILHYATFQRLSIELKDPSIIEWAIAHGLHINIVLPRSLLRKLLGYTPDSYLSCFDISIHLYNLEGFKEDATAIMALIARSMSSQISLALIYRMIAVEHRDIRPVDLKTVCIQVVNTSDSPVTTSVQVAGIFKSLSKKFLTDRNLYLVEFDFFTRTALNLLDDITSDEIVSLFLESRNNHHQSIISEAITSENGIFLGNPRISRIFESIWSEPFYMNSESSKTGTIVQTYECLRDTPKRFFLLPYGKFVIRALSFILFLVTFSLSIALQRSSVAENLNPIEVLVWIMALGFISSEVEELRNKGWASYVLDEWNMVDMFIYLNFIPIVFIRFSGVVIDTARMDVPYRIFITANIILLWIRVMYLFVIHPTLGPLQRMIFKMLKDILNFFFVMVLVWVGFSLAFFFILAGENNPEFIDFDSSLLSSYLIFVGAFEPSWFQDIESFYIQGFVSILLCIYIAIGLIVLLNLLIAMMSETYSNVQSDSMNEFLFGKSKLAYEYNRSDATLPPPFSLVVDVFFGFSRTLNHCFGPVTIIDSQIQYLDRKFIEEKVLTTQMTGLNLQFDNQELNEVSVSNSSAKSVRAAMIPKELRKVIDQRHWNELSKDLDNFKSWRCGLCHNVNNESSYVDLLQYLFKNDFTEDKISIQYLNPKTRVCSHCFRLKRVISERLYSKEMISFRVFKVFLWFPMVILFYIAATVKKLLDRTTNNDPFSDVSVVSRTSTNCFPIVPNIGGEKSLWVERNLAMKQNPDHIAQKTVLAAVLRVESEMETLKSRLALDTIARTSFEAEDPFVIVPDILPMSDGSRANSFRNLLENEEEKSRSRRIKMKSFKEQESCSDSSISE